MRARVYEWLAESAELAARMSEAGPTREQIAREPAVVQFLYRHRKFPALCYFCGGTVAAASLGVGAVLASARGFIVLTALAVVRLPPPPPQRLGQSWRSNVFRHPCHCTCHQGGLG